MLLASNFLDQSPHPNAVCDQACPCAMHGHQKIVAGTVNTCDFRHVDFDLFARARRRAPGVFRFANPRAGESACEFQARLAAILMKRDS